MEMFIILAFALGWGVLELVGLRLDRKRRNREAVELARLGEAAAAGAAQGACQPALTDLPGEAGSPTSPGGSGIERA